MTFPDETMLIPVSKPKSCQALTMTEYNAALNTNRSLIVWIGLISLLLCLGSPSHAQNSGIITIIVKQNQTIRQIAEEYLKDPDLWQDILRANNLKSAADVLPGITLNIPVKSITDAKNQLEVAKETIAKANETGAKVFASTHISKAVALFQSAHEQRTVGNWKSCFEQANLSYIEAKEALKISIASRESSAEAILKSRKGTVQSRTQTENMWNDAKVNSSLVEGEKIRTLTKSYAEVQFADESRIRLKENSQALIRRMKVNNLNNKSEAEVSLVSGDLHAFLSGGNSSKDFKLEVPGVETNIQSSNFWVNLDQGKKTSRFANYDGKLELEASGSKVVLEQNEGSVIKPNSKPTAPRKLLKAPMLALPENNSKLFGKKNDLKWVPIKEAIKYQIEIATDDQFNDIVMSETSGQSSQLVPTALQTGVFFWRVTSVDAVGLPGRPSSPRSFTIIHDNTPPYLVVNPIEETVYVSPFTISGETEIGMILRINDKEVPVNDDGHFTAEVSLKESDNVLIIKANDLAGNISTKELHVKFSSTQDVKLNFDDQPKTDSGAFAIADSLFSLGGTTDPGNLITVSTSTGKVEVQTYANEKGLFKFNLTLSSSMQELIVTSQNSSDKSISKTIKVDANLPKAEIIINSTIPSITSTKSLIIEGEVIGGITLKINESIVSLSNGQFRDSLQLNSGINTLEILAQDVLSRVTVVNREVYLDVEPPQLITKKLITEPGSDLIVIRVNAKDKSELKRVAAYSVQIGDRVQKGYLRLSEDKSLYEGSFMKPAGSGNVKLKSVILEDYYGNKKEYQY